MNQITFAEITTTTAPEGEEQRECRWAVYCGTEFLGAVEGTWAAFSAFQGRDLVPVASGFGGHLWDVFTTREAAGAALLRAR